MLRRGKIPSIEEIKERLSPLFREEGLNLVVLFGSTVTGSRHPKSDIDLAFLFENPVDILALTNRVIRLLRTDRVDIVDLKHASPLLKLSAMKKGKPIYERSPGLFNHFYSIGLRMYIDTRKLREANAKAIKHYLETRGLA